MNNNTKARFIRLNKAQRREQAEAGRDRKSRYPKVARHGDKALRETSRQEVE